ncbi:MAG TPA: alpha/beta hydrolase [Chthoniobacterales bacterium]|nr:alpha/beta hydrolase [Chthoniobacterales bacterium]
MLQRNKAMAAGREIHRIHLPERGGDLAYLEYGDRMGRPVLFCHGWPSSSTMGELTDAAARDLGVRIISPDRPGICNSALITDRKLLDWPPIAQRLADHLGLTDFHVLAISGGAPYAFATGWALPERVRAIAVVSGAPPLFDLREHNGLLPIYRWMLALNRKAPALLRTGFRAVRPFVSMKSSVHVARKLLRMLQPCDAEALRDAAAFDACFQSQRRAWRGSAYGVMLDAQIYAQPWGFPLNEIRVPVRLWHGKQDRSFSYRLAEDVARQLPNCRPRIVDNAGHYSLPIRNMREILQDLIEAG